MVFPANIQTKINELLTLIVQAGDSISLDRLLANDFMPDNQVDLITVAAGIGTTGDDRDQVLAVLLRNGVK
ncbi:transcription factor [Megaira polyxenophila phage MAnkyphage_25.80]|nr:transcription factor [Megaira polyxenophila phage MAnkyphage_25.80]